MSTMSTRSLWSVADVWAGEGVVVAHEARVLDAVQEHVRRAEHVRQRLLLHGPERLLHQLLVLRGLDVPLAHVAHRAGEEAAGATRGVEKDLSGLRIDPLCHERGDGPRRVVLAGVACALQVVEELLVDVAEVLPDRRGC